MISGAGMTGETTQASDAVSLIPKDRNIRRNATREEVAGWILLPPETRTLEQVRLIVFYCLLCLRPARLGKAIMHTLESTFICLVHIAKAAASFHISRKEGASMPVGKGLSGKDSSFVCHDLLDA